MDLAEILTSTMTMEVIIKCIVLANRINQAIWFLTSDTCHRKTNFHLCLVDQSNMPLMAPVEILISIQ